MDANSLLDQLSSMDEKFFHGFFHPYSSQYDPSMKEYGIHVHNVMMLAYAKYHECYYCQILEHHRYGSFKKL